MNPFLFGFSSFAFISTTPEFPSSLFRDGFDLLEKDLTASYCGSSFLPAILGKAAHADWFLPSLDCSICNEYQVLDDLASSA